MPESFATGAEAAVLARVLFAGSSEPLFLLNPSTDQILDANPSAERLTGTTAAELIGQPIALVLRDAADHTAGRLRSAVHAATETTLSGYRMTVRGTADGLAVVLTATPVPCQPPLVLLAARLDRSDVRTRLREIEDEWRRVLEAIQDCLWSADLEPDGTWIYRYISPVIERITGRPADFFYPGRHTWDEVVHPEDVARFRNSDRMLLRGQRNAVNAEYQFRVTGADGVIRWVRDSVRVTPGTTGQPARLDGVLSDMTARVTAEQAVRASEDRLRRITDTNPNAIVLLDPDGRVRSANPAAEVLFGRRNLEGTHWRELGWQSTRPELGQTTRPGVEQSIRRPDGTTADVVMQLARLSGPNDEPEGLVASFTDVTERRRAEEEVRQLGKLEAIGQLAGGVAHDFNNLLTAILGNVGLALAKLPAESPLREPLADVEQAAVRGAEVTSQLLGFARRSVLRPVPTALNSVVGEVVKLLRRTFDPRIEIVIAARAEPWVMADAGQLHQVVMNLCVNARDAMPDGGTLELVTAEAGDFARLSVADTGGGIPPAVLARMYEPFFTTKGPGRGTGLGLPMALGIVQQHGGRIECDTRPGHGTRFDIVLPRCPPPPPGVAEPPPPVAGGNEVVLLVDDEPMIRGLGRVVLEEHGYEVLQAADGVEAVDVYRRHGGRIQFVVMDLTMPRMSGRDALRHILAINPAARVLLMSGYAEDGLPTPTDTGGAVGFLHKPFRPRDLAAAVRAGLDGRRSP